MPARRVAGSLKNDVWELSLVGTPTWKLLAAGDAAQRAAWRGAIYDPVRDRGSRRRRRAALGDVALASIEPCLDPARADGLPALIAPGTAPCTTRCAPHGRSADRTGLTFRDTPPGRSRCGHPGLVNMLPREVLRIPLAAFRP